MVLSVYFLYNSNISLCDINPGLVKFKVPVYLFLNKSTIIGKKSERTVIELGIEHILIPHAEETFAQSYCRTPLGGFYNHSKDPNCYLKPRLIYFCASTDHKRLVTTVMELYALEDIPKDTEITTEYTLYEMDS